MCYHKEEKFTSKELVKHYKIGFPEENVFEPRAEVNGFDHAVSPIITNQKPHEIQLCTWGLLPHWAKDLKLQNMTLNAKAESMHEKPSFKQYTDNRCLVPTSALYEWEHKGKVKEKNRITVDKYPIFSLAGLWNVCPHPITGEPFKTFTCVTLNGFVAILADDEAWMNDGKLLVNPNTIWTPLVAPQTSLF
jgi:putative SOS response-associated peptidase YedK